MRTGQPPVSPRRSVALLIETSNRYSRELLQGIRDFMRKQGNWTVHLTEHGRGDVPPAWLKSWDGDGVIVRIENRRMERAVRRLGVPVINVSASGIADDFPSVISDSEAIARLAAEHLIERGFRHFGYCGDARFAWSKKHGANFMHVLTQAGFKCSHFASRQADFSDWQREKERLAAWIKRLPKPVGIMTCFDIRGQQVIDVCRELGISIPDVCGVIGQHNDDLLCELCDPPLSSVIPNPQQAGYKAAELLEAVLREEHVEARTYPITPIGVATRLSTDLVAVDDHRIADAVRFVRQHAFAGIGVADILQTIPVSRTMLERAFKEHFNRSPYDMIQQVRFQRATELLAKTDLSIAEIAEKCGFQTAEYFSATFKKRIGTSPRDYRRNR